MKNRNTTACNAVALRAGILTKVPLALGFVALCPTRASKWVPRTLAMTSLLAVLLVTGSVTNRATPQTREPPSASPEGGGGLRPARRRGMTLVDGPVHNRATAQTRERPSASPKGGESLRLAGGVELTREQLAEFIRAFRGPNPDDFADTEAEVHTDDEGTGRTLSGSEGLTVAAESEGSALLPQTPEPGTRSEG